MTRAGSHEFSISENSRRYLHVCEAPRGSIWSITTDPIGGYVLGPLGTVAHARLRRRFAMCVSIAHGFYFGESNCWRWTGRFDSWGKPMFAVGPHRYSARRFSLAATLRVNIATFGTIRLRMRCGMYACVNPAHMTVGTNIPGTPRTESVRKE